MIYFKHTELAKEYHVSLKTVHNWIDAAKQGKLDLKLHEENSRVYVANTPTNHLVLDRLADNGKKYRNSLHHKVVSPKPEFYQAYSRRQILDIISSLNIHHEIPQQYNYFKEGATDWDAWIKRLDGEDSWSMLKGSVSLLRDNRDAIDRLLEDYDRINIVDMGVGNALPVRELLGYLADQGKLNRYIAIDISQNMLDIAERNIQSWFGDRIAFEGHRAGPNLRFSKRL